MSSFWDNLVGSMTDNAGAMAQGAAGLAASNYAVNQGQDALGSISNDLMNRSGVTNQGSLASQVQGMGQFRPFAVTNNLGGSSFDPNTGQMNITGGDGISQGLMGQAQQMSNQLGQNSVMPYAQNLQMMGNQQFQGGTQDVSGAFNNVYNPNTRTGAGGLANQAMQSGMGMMQQGSPDAQGIYDKIRAMQSPEEERQRLGLENRLAGQGRLGIQTNAFGGTPEQLAMQKAQAEAQNSAAYQALSQSDQMANSQQQRAMQMSQLGLSADQIQSQMDNQGFNRDMQLGQGMLQSAQVGSGLQTDAINRGSGLFGMGLQAQQAQGQMQGQDIQNMMQMMQASGIPLEQQLAALQPTLAAQGMQQTGDLAQLNAFSQLGSAELGMLKELGLGNATLDQELLRTIGNIFAGGGRTS